MSLSPEVASTPARSEQSHGKHKQSKKRKHQDQAQEQLDGQAQETPSQHKKKRRRHDPDAVHDHTTANTLHTDSTALMLPEHPRTHNVDLMDAPQETSQAQGGITEDSSSPFFEQSTSFYLPLSPIGQLHPLESLCAEHLSPLLLTYYPPLEGVVISYKNPRFRDSETGASESHPGGPVLARSINEYAVSYAWVTADFTLFKPVRGTLIEGHITIQSESHVGLLCWNLFNASIEAKRLPRSWRWAGGSGLRGNGSNRQNWQSGENINDMEEDGLLDDYYVDAKGIRVDGAVRFTVRDFETSSQVYGQDQGYMSIEGTLLTTDEEEQLAKTEAALANGTSNGNGPTRLGKKRHKDPTRDRNRRLEVE